MSNEEKDITTKEVMGFDLSLINIEDFKDFYKANENRFNSFSIKSFLKAIKIPPPYFLEQPEETQDELLENKHDIINRKLSGKYISVLKKDGSILNCSRVDYNELQNLHERISLNKEISSKLIPIKDFIKEGYSSNFIPSEKLEEGKYNLGVFIDYPLMLNKLPVVNIGFYYVPKKGEDNYKNIYVEHIPVDFNDYQNLDILIEDLLNIKIKEVKEEKIIEALKDKLLLRELDEILLKLQSVRVIPKSYTKKISKYVYKNDIRLLNVLSLVELISSYEQGFYPNDNYKQVVKLRNCLNDITLIIDKVG